MQRVGDYADLVNSVCWLTDLREQNSKIRFQLIFVHDRSLGQKAMALFSADMATIGKEGLAEQVRAVQDRVALLAVGFGGIGSFFRTGGWFCGGSR